MIIDRLENWEQYHFGPAWRCAFEFLTSLPPDAEVKKYPLQGEEIFAEIATYKTKKPEAAVLETHRKYVDIQTVLSGSEVMECFSREGLEVDTPYDKIKDAEFYRRSSPGPTRVDLSPGTFVMLLPQDAHMPGLMIDERPELIKKVVVKIDLELLREKA